MCVLDFSILFSVHSLCKNVKLKIFNNAIILLQTESHIGVGIGHIVIANVAIAT